MKILCTVISLMFCLFVAGCGHNGPQENQKWTVKLGDGVKMEFVPIAAGSFLMGSENGDWNEKPVHRVTLTKPFWFSSTEVTCEQYEQLMNLPISRFLGLQKPVESVSWEDAMAFCEKLTAREHEAGRLLPDFEYTLPTEAQWEYACRAGTTGDFAGNLDEMCWYGFDNGPHAVGTLQANAWGLYDMHGNVWEWCSDWYDDFTYENGSVTNPLGDSSGPYRVTRGGGWFNRAADCRSASRDSNRFDRYDEYLGFRPLVQQRPSGGVLDEQSFGYYVVRTYSREKGGFEILRKGVRVYADTGFLFEIGGSSYEEHPPSSFRPIGTDITGDGNPNLLVFESKGGAHSLGLFHLFEIGDTFRFIQTLYTRFHNVDFENLDEDEALEFALDDWTFASWRNSSVFWVGPQIILKYRGNRYEMEPDLMRRPALPHEDLYQMAAEIKALPDWAEEQPPVSLWDDMLNLIYTGNMEQAWDLVQLSWPDGTDGKERFLTDFKAQLRESPFWEDIQRMNHQ